jgi:hypothetical protein
MLATARSEDKMKLTEAALVSLWRKFVDVYGLDGVREALDRIERHQRDDVANTRHEQVVARGRRKTAGREAWVLASEVESESERGVSHRIETSGDKIKCSCMAFRFAKGEFGSKTKTCKHVQAYSGATTQATFAFRRESVSVVGGETFRVRRSISLGPIGASR